MLTDGARLVPYEDAVQSPDDVLRLGAHALGATVAIVPASVAGFVRVTRRRTIEDGVTLGADDGAWQRHLVSAPERDPFAPERMADSDATVVALEDVGAGAAPYRWELRRLGLADRLTMYLRSAGTIVAAIALGRAIGDERFTKDDAAALRRIQPLIEHAYLCAVEPRTESGRELLLRHGLTEREADVAELVGRGATNAEIARSLHVSEATVKTHLMRVYVKTGVSSRTQLALLIGDRRFPGAHG